MPLAHSLVMDVDEREGFASFLEALANLVRRCGRVRVTAEAVDK